MLTKLGINQWQVDYCFDGREAIRCVKRAHETGMSYNLIFMDFNMPNMNGIEAARQIRQYLPQDCQPTIIGVTGHITSHFKEEGSNAGMQ